MGDYEFFWGAKKGGDNEFYFKEDLIECPKCFFGHGIRHMFGGLEQENPKLPYDFQYPIEFNHPIKEEFNSIIPELNQLEINKKTFFDNWSRYKVFGNDNSHLILTYLKLNKVIRFRWEPDKGIFIERLKEIKKLKTPYNTM